MIPKKPAPDLIRGVQRFSEKVMLKNVFAGSDQMREDRDTGERHQSAAEAVLALVPELAVETLESSCCGMAGAFGYGADTIDVSLKMAELSLLPAVRKAEADTLVLADGTSCRHQIKDGTGREALHVARVLEMSLAKAAG